MIGDGPLNFGVDTGGTFTDLVIEGLPEGLRFYKRPTTPDDPVRGLIDVLTAAAESLGVSVVDLLGRGERFIFGTTRATNAVVTGTTARTALIVTEGHPDILLFREGGGRTTLFDYTQEFPDPYIPRSLTFQAPERITSTGTVLAELDDAAIVSIVGQLREADVEAVAVCLLWSIVNPVHELRVGELLAEHLPDVPVTLSHQLNPSLREFRRASSAAIDASLKPLMSRFFDQLEGRLRAEGFSGRLLIMTSAGGVLDTASVADAPIHSIGSGPAAAPVAGRHFARLDDAAEMAIVTDAGGTTYDVSLIRRGQIPWRRDTTVGHATYGYITGFPSVDVRSIGAGGGSIARVDEGGLLHVGPESAGADPGPAAYGYGGTRATVTDACVALGYIDPAYFLGGEMELQVERAIEAIERDVGRPLGLSAHDAAAAVLELAIERMVSAIEEITLKQGIDPASALMIGGGGGAGLYSCGIARRLGTRRVIIPDVSAALSARGALLSELRTDYVSTHVTNTADFDFATTRDVLDGLQRQCEAFIAGPGANAVESHVSYAVEARYPQQVWEIEVPLSLGRVETEADVERMSQAFHDIHDEIFAVSDPDSPVEFVAWRARVSCRLQRAAESWTLAVRDATPGSRKVYFFGMGLLDTPVHQLQSLTIGDRLEGPAIIESETTTLVVPPQASVERAASGSLLLTPWMSVSLAGRQTTNAREVRER